MNIISKMYVYKYEMRCIYSIIGHNGYKQLDAPHSFILTL